ncbi:hypothetical protein L228DRAFT_279581 [Xylona heveae TC161]|uniref:HMG box domain-containing protein n=1 Tax=Xylona heveae (strain CBS 132557 / TC161) TaxID=1328760 RepID=A0A165JL13_XYLHT|nr:hypothetical protein L228DRAFT_279581 [Xylona heveae TC161]KZF26371.1 hypothetical protein L228DRAFT_279581 [Xylona heveae TC161]
MIKRRPVSPSSSNNGGVHYSLQPALNQNRDIVHPHEYCIIDGSYPGPYRLQYRPELRPAEQDSTQFANMRDVNDVGLGIRMGRFGDAKSAGPMIGGSHEENWPGNDAMIKEYRLGHNEGLSTAAVDPQSYLHHAFNIYNPPTPESLAQSQGGSQILSGRSMASSESPPMTTAVADSHFRPSKSPRPKKITKQGKADKAKIPKINAPLSVLTKDFEDIPIRDMREWVNRSIETRHKEVEKRNGYIARPMNSFMLYRSAFAERTKQWCLQNNHQVVSSVSGESWPLEPPEVRDEYNEYAKVERINHQNAHPGYKFSPSKAQTNARKRKPTPDDEDEEMCNVEDADFDWVPQNQRKTRLRSNKRQGRGTSSKPGDLEDAATDIAPPSAHIVVNKSSYQATNPGKPPPAAMGTDLNGHYYQTTVHQHANVPNVEDVKIRKTERPAMQYNGSGSLISLPGAEHYDLLQPASQQSSPAASGICQVDPLLLAYDSNYGSSSSSQPEETMAATIYQLPGQPTTFNPGFVPSHREIDHAGYGPFPDGGFQTLECHGLPFYHSEISPFADPQELWRVESDLYHADCVSEFNKWVD